MDEMQAIKSLLEKIKLAKKPSAVSDADRKLQVCATIARLYRYASADGMPRDPQ